MFLPATSDVLPLENKTPTVCNMVTKAFPILSETALKPSAGPQVKPKEDVRPSEFKDQSASPHTSSFEIEEAPAARLDTVVDREGSIQSESESYTDQSSEEQVGVPSTREDYCLESPPGFDVLVDDRSRHLAYEDDAEYPVGIERDGRQFNGHYFGYDYADYAGTLHEERRIDSCVDLEDEIDDQRLTFLRSSRYDDEKMNPGSFWEEELLPVSLSIDRHRGVDLRSYPRNDRVPRLPCFSKRSGHRGGDLRSYPRNDGVIDDPRLPRFSERSYFSERTNFPPNIHCNQETPLQNGRQRSCSVGKLGVNKRQFKAPNSSGQFMKSHPNISRPHHKETRQSKRPASSLDSSRKPVTRKKETKGYSEFSGPKSLDQIKAEKRRGTGNGDPCGNSRPFSKKTEEFQGP